jgi:hypothetical protein
MPGSLNLLKISTTEIETNEIRSLDPNISISLLNTDIKLQQLSSDPASNTAGQLYYNTTDSIIKYFNGTSWVSISGGSDSGGGGAGNVDGGTPDTSYFLNIDGGTPDGQ